MVKLQRSTASLVCVLSVAFGVLVHTETAYARTLRLVSPTGTDSGDCTVDPCRTITYAIGQSMSGDTISIAAGTGLSTVVDYRVLVVVMAVVTALSGMWLASRRELAVSGEPAPA